MENKQTVETKTEVPAGYRTTSTGRPTLVGTRKCSECGRPEYHTKKFEESGNPEDLNQRYTLCKGVCVYCYAKKRNKSTGTSLSVDQLKAKIKFYEDLLLAKTNGNDSTDVGLRKLAEEEFEAGKPE
jgi:hypothetical protein